MKIFTVFATLTVSLSVAAKPLHADVVGTFEIGVGDSTSSFLFQFTNGNQYLYELSYSGVLSGQDAIEIIAAEQASYFIPDIISYSFGDSLNGLAIGDDEDSGFGGTAPDYADYWHYWLKDDVSEEWSFASFGFSDRLISDGSWDGWVFNSNAAPVPAFGTIFGLAGLSACRRRRR